MKKITSKQSVGFLCIDTPYFLYHLLGIGYELSKNEAVEVVFFTTNENLELVEYYRQFFKGNKIRIIRFACLPFLSRSSNAWKYLPINIFRFITLLLNFKKIKGPDAIVAPLYDYIFIKRFFPDKYYIYSTHGMPSSEYALSKKITEFDLFFLYGEWDRLEREKRNQLTTSNHRMVGFSKYDLIKSTATKTYFKNDKPIILYNPHWNPELSSYFKFGTSIIDLFAQNKKYNFIFAPHVKLRQKNIHLTKKLMKFDSCSHILIDLGSQACIDMSYTRCADFYLGDVSSQAIEFLFIKPRPCLFIDLHNIKSKSNLKPITWHFGPVHDEISDLLGKIDSAFLLHDSQYKETQIKKSKTMFFKGLESPSELAAKAITSFLKSKTA